jgi:hypothetical protein
MSIDYQFTDADNNSPRKVEPGEYKVEVTGFEFGMSTTGKDKLTIDLNVKEADVTLKEDIYFTPSAQWKFDTVIKCFAPSKKKRPPSKGDRVTVNDAFVEEYIQGGTGEVTIEDDEHNGNVRSRVKVFKAGAHLSEPGAGSGQANLLEDEEDSKDVPF